MFSLFFLLVAVGVYASSAVVELLQPPSPDSSVATVSSVDRGCPALEALLTEMLLIDPIERKSEKEMDEILRRRPCLKTYPWPQGVFVTGTEQARRVTAQEMRVLRDDVSDLIEIYRSEGMSAFRDVEEDGLASRVSKGMKEGWDSVLVDRFGTILLLQLLIAEERYAEAQQEINRAFGRWYITARDARWDTGDEHTYFSYYTQDNLFLLLKYITLAKVGAATRTEAVDVAAMYARVRQLLSDEIGMLGDPAAELLWNAGCAPGR